MTQGGGEEKGSGREGVNIYKVVSPKYLGGIFFFQNHDEENKQIFGGNLYMEIQKLKLVFG
jgi:hypothetical protein